MQLVFRFFGFRWHTTFLGAAILALLSSGWLGFLVAGHFSLVGLISGIAILTLALAILQLIKIGCTKIR
jgi:hypothetical protein